MEAEEVVEQVNSELGEVLTEINSPKPERHYVLGEKDRIRDIAEIIYEQLEGRLATITGRDIERGIQLLYHFVFDSAGFYFTVRLQLDREQPEVDSIHEIIPGAAAVEREISDFLGVEVENVRSAENFLKFEGLPDDYYPLRQDVEGPPDE